MSNKTIDGSDNVFRDLGFPEAEAQNLKLRSALMIQIEKHVARLKLSQVQAAQYVGLTQPRLNDLLRGRIEKFSLDALVNVASRLGFDVQVKLKKADLQSPTGNAAALARGIAQDRSGMAKRRKLIAV
jgi:predicted XRE-type DNA-binding protein